MIFRLLFSCLALLLVLLAAFSLEGRESRADFTYVNPSDIHTLDPARMSWLQDFRVALNIWEGLTIWNPKTMDPMEGASHFPPQVSEDGRTYTFTIRTDARWSTGEPVVAADFVRGWRRSFEPGTAMDYAFLFSDHIEGAAEYVAWRNQAISALNSDVASADRTFFSAHVAEMETRFSKVAIHAVDDRSLVVRLINPCPYFLDLTAMPAFLPCHESIEILRVRHEQAPITANGLVIYDPQWTKPDYQKEGYSGLVTNGPYRLVDWKFKRRARLELNPHHRAAAQATCRTVDMLVMDNLNAALTAYESGDVDFLPEMGVPFDHEIARLAMSGRRPDFHLCPVLATYFLNFNCATEAVDGRPNPLLHRGVRKALSLAVDRDQIVHNVRRRGDRVATSLVPKQSIDGYSPPDGLSTNPAEARRLLAEAGFPGGAGLEPIQVLYTQNDERVIQAIARMWELELGVRTELNSKESKTFGDDKTHQRFMVARGKWYADYNDPTTFLDCLKTNNGNNDSGYSNPSFDLLLQEAEAVADPAHRAVLLARAEAILIEEDCPVFPIFHFTEPVAIKPYVQGLYPNPRLWFSFRNVRVQR